MRVLIIEDERRLADNIRLVLEQETGYGVDTCYNGLDGLHLGLSAQHDLVILDLMLPEMDGLEILRRMRAKRVNTPVLVLTARSTREEIVQGLDLGCDDYLTKPFDIKELIARSQALIRRSFGQASSVIEVGELTIDCAARRVCFQGHSVTLSAKEYQLLEYLALRTGRIVTKSQIQENLYSLDAEIDSNVIEVYVSALRKQLDPTSPHHLIHTIRGQGYLLEWRP
jgi:DNA-binding response OmpR family regulator